MSAVADVLRAAADRLERTGKYEGDLWDTDQLNSGVPRAACRACALGAIEDAASENWHLFDEAKRRLTPEIGAPGERRVWIYEWSDAHSLAEVVAGLRAAADGAA